MGSIDQNFQKSYPNAIEYGIRGKNLIANFFFRATVCAILLALFWGVTVYVYQTRHIKKELFLQAEKAGRNLIEGRSVPFSKTDSRVFENLIDISGQKLTDFRIVMLDVYDSGKHAIFHYASDPDVNVVRKGKKIAPKVFPLGDQDDFAFIELQDNLYLQIFDPVYDHQKLLGFMDFMVEVDQKILNRFRKARTMALVMTISTILTMTLVLYPLIYTSYRKLQRSSRELLESHLYTIMALGNAIAERDSDTDAHNHRVTYYSLCLAEHLKLAAGPIRTLVKGAFLHDVGKIGIRDNILLKPGKLTDEEFAVMQTHVKLGAQIVKDVPWLADSQEVIRFHHERYDGSGYPFGRTGEQIPLVARIFAVVDVFDALTSPRPYKSAFSYMDALEILKQEVRQFDPWVLKGFFKISEALYNETALMGKKQLENRLAVKLSRYFGI